MPSVKKKVVANANPKPSHAVFHSQSFCLQMCDFERSLAAVGPGVSKSAMAAVMIAGKMTATTNKTPVEIFSCST